MSPESSIPDRKPGVTPVLQRNIQALLAKRQEEVEKLEWKERVAIAIANFTGSMTFVFLHVIIYGAWIAINLKLIPGLPRFDPSLVILAMEASVEAIFLSSFILITQNRMMAQADRRADLNLQISLLAEHEITRLMSMVQAMAKRMNIEEAGRPELAELMQDVVPEKVLETIDENEKRFQEGHLPR
jgi:uncharacterized membrane protein